MASFMDRIQHAWNTFSNPDNFNRSFTEVSSSYRLDRVRLIRGEERSINTAIYNRIAVDVSAISIQHAKVDDNYHYMEIIDSPLNQCLNVGANVDQTDRAFIQDVVMSLLNEGSAAIVPTDTSINPNLSSGYDIYSMRAGKVVEWMPRHVKVRLYNEKA